MITAQLLFAAMAVGARISGRGVPWQEVCASRFFVGALTAYAVARARGQSLRIANLRDAWVRSGFGTLAAAGTFFLYAASPALALGDAATLMATSPIFVAILSLPMLREPIHRTHMVALVLGFGGIALVAQPTFSTARHLAVIGGLTALSSALAMIWLRRIGPTESSEAIVLHFALVGLGATLLLSIPVWQTPSPRDAAALAATGLCAGLAQLAMTRAYALDHAARVSALTYSGVVFARVLAAPFFGEVPDTGQVAGSVLVIGSGILLAAGARGDGRAEALAGTAPR